MGAEFNSHVFADKQGKKKIEQVWNSAVEDSLYESGHSYSGAIGMLGKGIANWHDKEFASQDEAQEFLSDTQQKWQQADAVSFKNVKGEKYWVIGGWCSS